MANIHYTLLIGEESMYVYLITYDLNIPRDEDLYTCVRRTIKTKFGGYYKLQGSVWAIGTRKNTIGKVMSKLYTECEIDANDRFIVLPITNDIPLKDAFRGYRNVRNIRGETVFQWIERMFTTP